MFERLVSFFPRKKIVAATDEALKPETPVKAPKGEVGWSESLLYARSSWPKYNPDDLMGMKGAKVYKKMLTDEQVKSVTRFKRDAITGRKWYFKFDKRDEEDAQKQSQAGESGEVGGDDSENGGIVPTKQPAYRRARFDAMPPNQGDVETKPAPGDEGKDPAAEDPNALGDAGEEGLTPEQELKIRVFEEACLQLEGSFTDALNSVVSAMYCGFSLTEKVHKDIEVDGKTWVGLKRLALKPFDTFKFYPDEYGNIDKCVQCWEGREQEIDLERFIHYVQNPEVDPHYGQSELREAYRAWFSKDMAIRFYNIHLERHASGFVWVAPKEGVELRTGTQQYNDLVNVLTNLSAKTAIILPSGLELHLEQPVNTDAYERAIALHDKSIAKALLVPNLLGVSEQGDKGSYGQSQTQLEAFLWVLDAEAGRVAETLNEQLFKPLGEMNFGSGPYPKFCFKPISDALKLQIIKTWKDLVSANAVEASDTDEAHLRELLEFPEKGKPRAMPIDQLMPGGETDPNTGKPIGLNPSGKAPIGKNKGNKKPGLPDETVMGKKRIAPRYQKEVFARAIKRVDFAVIENKAMTIAGAASAKLTAALKDGLDDMKLFITENNVIGSPDKVAEVQVPTRTMTRARKSVEAALREAWEIGHEQARREMEKARASRFAVDELRLRDEAAEKFLQSRSYTIAGDLADSQRKKVTTVLYNGIKGGWPLNEILSRIDDEVGAGVLPHASTAVRTTVFEAINEARYDLFASPEMQSFIEALEYSSIIDGKTTEVCEHMDGRIYPVGDDVWDHYTPPLHFNCRSLLVAVTVRDTWERSPDPDVEPEPGFGGG